MKAWDYQRYGKIFVDFCVLHFENSGYCKALEIWNIWKTLKNQAYQIYIDNLPQEYYYYIIYACKLFSIQMHYAYLVDFYSKINLELLESTLMN